MNLIIWVSIKKIKSGYIILFNYYVRLRSELYTESRSFKFWL